MSPLFPALSDPSAKTALRFGEQTLTYAELADVAAALAGELTRGQRIAVWATSSMETCVALVAGLLAGAPVVPLNPKSGERELAHVVGDSEPALVLAEHKAQLPPVLRGLRRVGIDTAPPPFPVDLPEEPDDEAPALIVYTSGTTGPPKGAVLPRRALAASLDGLRDAWQWTERDVLVHGLPLFHVHGLVLGVAGPLRRGGTLHHLGRFSTDGVRQALDGGGTMLFGVPTMYHRIGEEVGADGELAKALTGARLLVSGSAALPVHEHERIEAATGQRIVERYGMTETLINTSVRADGERRAGTVGLPVDGVELRLVDEKGQPVEERDGETVGEIQVRGRNLFTEYLNRPDATAEAFDGDWFRTGDVATLDPDGYVRIVGRKATDLIESGGYKIGAGEIENALLEHPAVAEVAVTGEPDEDLGERVVAWVVLDGGRHPGEGELADHVAGLLAPHKRPRDVRYRESLPRNDMGKVLKRELLD